MTQTTSHILAFIADCYTPILLLLALVDVGRYWVRGNKFYGLRLIFAVLVVYVWMFADKYFQLWASAGLDYSTHTAAALALVVIVSLDKRIPIKLLLASSLISYGCLMNLLGYHSWADMFTTALATSVSLSLGYGYTKYRMQTNGEG